MRGVGGHGQGEGDCSKQEGNEEGEGKRDVVSDYFHLHKIPWLELLASEFFFVELESNG